MNLIELYIQEVTRRLPEKNRKDIALELRSTIEDMLPSNYSEDDVRSVLEKLGDPVTLAGNYQDRPRHLIGPRYFDVYLTLLKMILPIAAVISLITMLAEYFIGYSGDQTVIESILSLLGKGIARIIGVGIQTFFWLTVVFAIIERMDKGKDSEPLAACLKKWTPDDLKNIPKIPKQKAISKIEVFGRLMWTAIWSTLYFYANQLVGVYQGGNNGIEFVTPAFNQNVLLQYWPIVVLVIGLEIALALYKLTARQWTKNVAICHSVVEVLGTLVFIVILVHPHLLNHDFITYLTNLFSITAGQLKMWIVGGIMSIFAVFAVFNVIDGFRKAGTR